LNPGFAGYNVTGEVSRGEHSVVLRAVRESDGRRVILKVPRQPRPSLGALGRFEREYRLGKSLSSPSVVEYLDREEIDGRPVLVLEDIGGSSLDRALQSPLPFPDALELAVAIARTVAAVHQCGVIHKDVNPSNLVWNPESGALQLIDLGIATRLTRQMPEVRSARGLEGTLRYLAPEQTGRMARTIDRRADLYALGATLYEVFSGRPPFAMRDALELVHAHLAQTPAPLMEISEVPGILSSIVERLLRKAPEDRYQTADAVVADLARCLRELADTGSISSFELTLGDEGRLRIPQRLYGREAEVKALLAAFDRTSAGGREIVLVAGAPGIGKTALVRQVHRAVALRRGIFLEGKFDQLRLGTPCQPIGEALGQFVHRVLGGDDADLERWRDRCRQALGPNGRVLCELAPDLELLVGPQAEVSELPATEAENRLHLVFREFVRTLASAEHPLVLFLDDLQWADLPSLRLLERLATDAETSHLLLIGAWREEEVDAAHPLTVTLGRLTSSTPTRLALGPLRPADVNALVVGALRAERQQGELRALTDAIFAKTLGNPFFLIRFLDTLAERGLVRFDEVSRRWTWEMDAIASVERSANVVELLIRRIEQLAERTRTALQAAACVGKDVDLRLLTELLASDPATVQADLEEAVRHELVLPRGMGWPLEAGDTESSIPKEAFYYAFVHDRVQQAAHETLAPEAAKALHLRLGQLLLAPRTADPPGSWLFDVVNHLNEAVELLPDAKARSELAARDLEASRLARRAAAFGSALQYAEAGIRALADDAWEADRELATALFLEAAESAFASARFERMDELLDAVREHAATPLDRVRCSRIDIDARIARHDLLGAIETARTALSLLDLHVSAEPTGEEVGAAVGQAMAALGTRTAADIARLDDAADPTVLAAMDILVRTATPAYYAVPMLLPIVACKLVALSVEHGLSPGTPFALAVYGIVLNTLGQHQRAHELGELALELLDRWKDRHLEARTRHVVNNLVCVWVTPFHDRIGELREVSRIGRETGDLEYAAIAAHSYVHNAWYGGWELGPLEVDADRYTAFMENYGQQPMLRVHLPIARAVHQMAGSASGDAARLDSADFDEAEALQSARDTHNRSAVFILLLQMTLLRYHFVSADEAWELASEAWEYQDGVPSTYHLPVFHQYAALSALGADLSGEARVKALSRVEQSLAHLRAWAEAGPINHRHRVLLIEGELAAYQGDRVCAAALYREAVDAVAATGFRNDEALILERAGRFSLRGGIADQIAGRALLEAAWLAYGRWGAGAKVAALEAEFPLHLPAGRVPDARGSSRVTVSPGERLDLDSEAVVRASLAISAQLELAPLLSTLFRLSLQSTGAQRGILLLQREGRWRIVVEGSTEDGERASLVADETLDGASPADRPLSPIRYVLRTGEPLAIDDALEEDGLFANDPYLRRRGVKSMLVVPLIRTGSVAAVLCLENDRVRGAFTRERVELLRVLMSQAAVSMANAELYERLEEQVASRTRELAERNSQLVRAQGEVRGALAQTRAILDNVADGLVAIDRDGWVQAANPAFSRLMGIQVPEPGAQTAREVLPAALAALAEQAVAKDDLARIELPLPDERVGAAVASPIHGGPGGRSHPAGAVVVVRDITLEKEVDRMKTQLTATVSHELRTPLTSILGFAKLIRSRLDERILPHVPATDTRAARASQQVRESIDIVIDEGERLARLVNDVLDISKMESGRMEWTMIPLDPATVVQRSAAATLALFAERPIELRVDIEPDLPKISADFGWLLQVLINLVSNAAKFTERGTVALSVARKEERVEFAVTDTGRGIAPADRLRIFERFHQVTDAQTGKPKGTGLGLPICRQVLTAHGSELLVESEIGVGSRVSFALPVVMH
jgi:predicted ATPase/signal transduction histidine kinase